MTKFILTFAALFSVSSFASISEIKITSFRMIGDWPQNKGAEICGVVKFENEKLVQVDVTVDPGQGEGHYATLTDLAGNYCLVVKTYDGRAEATARSVLSLNIKSAQSTKAKISN